MCQLHYIPPLPAQNTFFGENVFPVSLSLSLHIYTYIESRYNVNILRISIMQAQFNLDKCTRILGIIVMNKTNTLQNYMTDNTIYP